MHDSQLAARPAPLSISDPADGVRARVPARARWWLWLASDTLAVFDAFVILGLLGIYLKLAMLAPQWGAVARFLGKEPGEPLGFADRLGFFASDVALNLVVVPVVGTLVVSALFRRWRVPAACILVALLSLVYFVELRASTEVGQFISGEMVRDFIGWSTMHPGSASEYLTPSSVIKLGALMAALAGLVVAARAARRVPTPRSRRMLAGLLAAPAIAALTIAAVLAPVAYALRLSSSPLNTSAVVRAATSLVTPALRAEGGSAWSSVGEALGALRTLTHTAPFDRGHALVGREAGSDLLIMMMETAPAQAFELGGGAPGGAGIDRLSRHALVSRRHYSAHPYSSDALFSVLSGTYPHGRRLLLQNLEKPEVTGLFSAMPADVGLRAIYLPSLYQIELDERMYGAFGARRLYISDRHPEDPLRARAEARADATLRDLGGDRLPAHDRARLRSLLVGDLQALERLKVDIARTIAAGGRYAVMFFPEISHGPWPQLRPGDADLLARGRALMDLQDAWLGELLDVIDAGRRLDRTVVAVTADHGLRTRAEYPSLRVGFLNDVMFRVPLLIYAPQAFAGPIALDAPTSHIDLAPTLLALLGAPDAAGRMHGIPVWQRTPRDRIYVLASAYGGADGFLQDGRFYMHQALSGAVYASDQFAFGDADQARPGDPVIPFVTRALEQARDGQHALVTRLRGE
jgi:hypothetical protein